MAKPRREATTHYRALTMRRVALLIYTMYFPVGVLAIVTALGMASALAQEPGNRAALIVRYGDGSTAALCVQFSEASITGEELLSRSGLKAVIDTSSGQGGAVCSINGSGCAFPQETCFCQCPGDVCEYWAYYHWTNGQWEYSSAGASLYDVTNGALEGWSWGPGNFSTGTEPPTMRFDQICGSTAATPIRTATASTTGAQQPASPDGTFDAEQNVPGQPEENTISTGPRVEGGTSSAARANGSYDRTFRPELLLGYAAFLIMAAILLMAGAWAVRRRQAASTTEPRK